MRKIIRVPNHQRNGGLVVFLKKLKMKMKSATGLVSLLKKTHLLHGIFEAPGRVQKFNLMS
jgi:hypothetical protein